MKRLTFEWNAVGALAILLIVTVEAGMAGGPDLTGLLEILAPLLATIAFSHVLAIDSEERALAMRYSYPPRRGYLVLERAMPAFAALLAILLVALLLVNLFAPTAGIPLTLAVVAPPAFALFGLTGLMATVTGSRFTAAIPSLIWWAVSFFTGPPGRTGVLGRFQMLTHLDQFSRPLDSVSLPVNRLLLLGLGLTFLAAAARVLERRDY